MAGTAVCLPLLARLTPALATTIALGVKVVTNGDTRLPTPLGSVVPLNLPWTLVFRSLVVLYPRSSPVAMDPRTPLETR